MDPNWFVGRFSGNGQSEHFSAQQNGIIVYSCVISSRSDVRISKIPCLIECLLLSDADLRDEQAECFERFRQLKYLDVSLNANLTLLPAQMDSLKFLDISGCAITRIELQGMRSLTSLNIQNLFPIVAFQSPPQLKDLRISREQLSFLDLSKTTVQNLTIEKFDERIDLCQLVKAKVQPHQYPQLLFENLAPDVPRFFFTISPVSTQLPRSLRKLVMRNLDLSSVDLAALGNLVALDVAENHFYSEDSVFPPKLEDLNMDSCHDGHLELAGLKCLKSFSAASNSFKTAAFFCSQKVSLQNNELLRTLKVCGPVTQVNVSGCYKLTSIALEPSVVQLNIENTKIEALDLERFEALEELRIGGCHLKFLYVAHRTLKFSGRQIMIDYYADTKGTRPKIAKSRIPPVCECLLRSRHDAHQWGPKAAAIAEYQSRTSRILCQISRLVQ